MIGRAIVNLKSYKSRKSRLLLLLNMPATIIGFWCISSQQIMIDSLVRSRRYMWRTRPIKIVMN